MSTRHPSSFWTRTHNATPAQEPSTHIAATQVQREADMQTVLTYAARQNRAAYSHVDYPEFERDWNGLCDSRALYRLLKDAPAVRESLIARLGAMLHTPIALRALNNDPNALVECVIAFPVDETSPAFDMLYEVLKYTAMSAEDVVDVLARVGLARILCDIRSATIMDSDIDARPEHDKLPQLSDTDLMDALEVEMDASYLFAFTQHADTEHCVALLRVLREIADRVITRFIATANYDA